MDSISPMIDRDGFTVLGASGFVGGALVGYLRERGHTVFVPERGSREIYERQLGHVIYAAGVTADFRVRPFDTMNAHVTALTGILSRAEFRSLTYLSSTRLYMGASSGEEETDFTVNPNNPDDLYNLSKLAGEATCLAHPNNAVRIARLSNVVGCDPSSDNFVQSLARDAVETGAVTMRTDARSAKDYIALDDVLRALRQVTLFGRHRIYNIAAGTAVTNKAITDELARLTRCTVTYAAGAPRVRFPAIDTGRIASAFAANELPWAPQSVIALLGEMVDGLRKNAPVSMKVGR